MRPLLLLATEIDLLRQVRDEHLLTNALGVAFTDAYYRISPPVADFVSTNSPLATMVRTAVSLVLFSIQYGLLVVFVLAFALSLRIAHGRTRTL